ncbi:MAG TPA: hypothetical protein VFG10_17680 [Saprospiraceae bacterium]|nr:hypothetical protein [Saprospiraceae bacterium]
MKSLSASPSAFNERSGMDAQLNASNHSDYQSKDILSQEDILKHNAAFKDGGNDPAKYQETGKYITMSPEGGQLKEYLEVQGKTNQDLDKNNEQAQVRRNKAIGTPELIATDKNRQIREAVIRQEGGKKAKAIYERYDPMRNGFNERSRKEKEPDIEPER